VFGLAKRRAAEILGAWGARSGAPIVNVLIPNVFGEHGAPLYNSFIATYCHSISRGESPAVIDDKHLELVHAQRIADVLLDQALAPATGTVPVASTRALVSSVLMRLQEMAHEYRDGSLPDLSDPFTRDLFNTYRSATFPEHWPVHPPLKSDARGGLVEMVKAAGGQAQAFHSSTNPGFTRGQHWHRRKVERFLVVRGKAEIRLRKLFTHEVVCFPVDGESPAIVDMPTMWVHSIVNTGPSELITVFYADEIFDLARPDTYPEEV
jgi:UDP-2-acetamido-2,6-beta-L-arabino-hexul-4-ose reductase